MEKKNKPEIRFKGFNEDWEECSLIETSNLLTGYPFSSKQFNKEGILLVRGMNVKRGFLDVSNNASEFWSTTEGLETYLLQEEDIVIQMDGALIGKSYAKIEAKHLPALLVQRVTRLRAEKHTCEIIYQYIQRDFLGYINSIKTETAVPHLSLNDIRDFRLKIPKSPNEQQKIGNLFENLDHTKLKALKKAMLDKMFPKQGQLVPDIRFKGFEGAWKPEKVGDVSDSFSGGTPPVGISKYYGGNIPFIRSGEINSDSTELFITELGLDESSAKLVNKGDILYALYGATSGVAGLSKINGAINQAVLAIIPNEDKDRYFIMQWLRKQRNEIISTYIQGGQGNLSGNIVKGLEIKFPSYIEQNMIGNYFKNLDELIDKHEKQITKMQNIKKAFLAKMFI
jgi:type I restriction enzyme, S subunit